MRTGKLDVDTLKWLLRSCIGVVKITVPFRDFFMECLEKHQQYDPGVFEPLIWSGGFSDRHRKIEYNRETMRTHAEYRDFRSAWYIPEECRLSGLETTYAFIEIITYHGDWTEVSVRTVDETWYKEYLSLKNSGLDILEVLE